MIIVKEYKGKIYPKFTTNYFRVPKGILTIKEWQVGTEYIENSTTNFSIYWDEIGCGVFNLIDTVYATKRNYKRKLNKTFKSNGNAQIIVKQWILGENKERETFLRWKGTLQE